MIVLGIDPGFASAATGGALLDLGGAAPRLIATYTLRARRGGTIGSKEECGMKQVFRRRRLSFCQRKAWGKTMTYMRQFNLDSTICLSYWGRMAYQIERPQCWRRSHYRWHGRWYRAEEAR